MPKKRAIKTSRNDRINDDLPSLIKRGRGRPVGAGQGLDLMLHFAIKPETLDRLKDFQAEQSIGTLSEAARRALVKGLL